MILHDETKCGVDFGNPRYSSVLLDETKIRVDFGNPEFSSEHLFWGRKKIFLGEEKN